MRHASIPALLLVAAALAPSAARANDYVNDPVTDPNFAGRGVRGGTFSASGWTTNAVTDTLWWEIPDALESGSVEFTVVGLSVGGTLVDNDNDLIAIYQAPDGMAEPINYLPYFRNNDLKVFLRIFGSAEGPDRQGATKLNLTACMQGPPYYHDSCPTGCPGTDTLAYAGGRVADLGWDPAHAYRMNISWANGTMSFSRDGQLLASVDYPGTYAPQPLRVRIGGPRSGQVAGASTPVGITISNVTVSGTPGVQTPACQPAPPPDAGTPPPVDGGACSADVLATQDTTAASWEPGLFSDPTDLNVEADATGNPTGVVYLRFPPAGGAVAHATLTLHTQTYSSAAGGSGQVCRVDDDTWTEGTLTWANRPAPSATCAGGARPVDPDQEVQWDVTSLIPPSGDINLAVISNDADGAHFISRESGGCSLGPRLAIQLAPPVTDAGNPESDSGTPAGDSGTPGGDSGSPGFDSGAGNTDAGAGNTDAGGMRAEAGGDASSDAGTGTRLSNCGCSTPGAARTGGASLAALGLALGAAARRRRKRDTTRA